MPTSGIYFIDGEAIVSNAQEMAKTRREKFGIVTQTPFLIENITPLENVIIPLTFDKKNKKDRYSRAIEALCSVGIDYGLKVKTSALSGGERQRVSIARAIVNNPPIILADEPTGNLDKENTETVLKILRNINKEGRTVIVITHDADVANECNRIVTLSDGEIVEDVRR